MPEKFKPGQFEPFESLPEEEKENFKKVDDGFVRKEALDLEEARDDIKNIQSLDGKMRLTDVIDTKQGECVNYVSCKKL